MTVRKLAGYGILFLIMTLISVNIGNKINTNVLSLYLEGSFGLNHVRNSYKYHLKYTRNPYRLVLTDTDLEELKIATELCWNELEG